MSLGLGSTDTLITGAPSFFLMASRGSALACTVLLVLSVASLLVLDRTDDSGGYNEDFTWDRDGNDVTIMGHGTLAWDSAWSGLETLTIVPEGGAVNIEDGGFREKSTLKTVTIEGSVGSIGVYAFYDCRNLTAVTIEGSADSIRISAFNSCDDLTTVTIEGSMDSIGVDAFENCNNLTTVTIEGSGGSIGNQAFYACDALIVITITGPITSIANDSFYDCKNLKTVNVHCTVDAEKGSTGNGYIAFFADTVNRFHAYSATYGWADDGKSCTVHIVCANTADHNHDESPAVTSTVKIQPTETTMGTTEYSVSGTYDGFAYSDTKDVQDIPATGGSGDGKKDNTVLYIAVGGAIAAIVLIGGFFLLRRRG